MSDVKTFSIQAKRVLFSVPNHMGTVVQRTHMIAQEANKTDMALPQLCDTVYNFTE